MITKALTVVALLSAAIQARKTREAARSLANDPLDNWRNAEPDSNVVAVGFSGECGGHNVFVGVTDNEDWEEDLITAWIDIDCKKASDSGIPLKFKVDGQSFDTGNSLKCRNWTTETYEGGRAFDKDRGKLIKWLDNEVKNTLNLESL